MCKPIYIKNKRFLSNAKNGGNIPQPISDRERYVRIPCGVCPQCKRRHRLQWQVRMHNELYTERSRKGEPSYPIWVAMTFSEDSINKIENNIKKEIINSNEILVEIDANEIATKAVRWWLERERKALKMSRRHWLVTELGHQNTERIHLHGFIWVTEAERHEMIGAMRGRGKGRIDRTSSIAKRWGYGHIWVCREPANSQMITYTVKYVTKVDKDHPGYKPIVLTSYGIGAEWVKTERRRRPVINGVANDQIRLWNGKTTSLPQYYRRKIWTEEEREQMFAKRLIEPKTEFMNRTIINRVQGNGLPSREMAEEMATIWAYEKNEMMRIFKWDGSSRRSSFRARRGMKIRSLKTIWKENETFLTPKTYTTKNPNKMEQYDIFEGELKKTYTPTRYTITDRDGEKIVFLKASKAKEWASKNCYELRREGTHKAVGVCTTSTGVVEKREINVVNYFAELNLMLYAMTKKIKKGGVIRV